MPDHHVDAARRRRRRRFSEEIRTRRAWSDARKLIAIVVLGFGVILVSTYLAHKGANSDLNFMAPPRR